MSPLLLPLQILLIVLAGWVNRRQLDVIAYLQEENRVLKEHLGGRRIDRAPTGESIAHWYRSRGLIPTEDRRSRQARRADHMLVTTACSVFWRIAFPTPSI
jgi:hypothetical protein